MIFGLYHHVDETVGLIADALKELKLPFRDVHLHDGDGLPRDTGDLEGLIVMGGPMNVDDVEHFPFLIEELRLIEKVIAEEKPVLGICLGAQLIAKALDARVYPNKVKEVGWGPVQLLPAVEADPVFAHAPRDLTVLHWHGDTFDLPAGAVNLARSKKCAHQAFRWGRSTYGLQFHLEATPGMVRSWCESKDGMEYIQAAGESKTKILEQTPAAFQRLQPVAMKIFSSYLTHAFENLLSVR